MTTTNTIRFDRFDYGTFRRGWRAEYAALSAEIRDLKQQRAVQSRTPGGAGVIQSKLADRQKTAKAMMEHRTEVDAIRGQMAEKMKLIRPSVPALAKAA